MKKRIRKSMKVVRQLGRRDLAIRNAFWTLLAGSCLGAIVALLRTAW